MSGDGAGVTSESVPELVTGVTWLSASASASVSVSAPRSVSVSVSVSRSVSVSGVSRDRVSMPGPLPPPQSRFLDALADRLALGVASVVALLDPGCVVLGGEVGQVSGDELAVRVAERVTRMSPLPAEVRPSVLGGAAVLRGALLTAQDGAQGELFG